MSDDLSRVRGLLEDLIESDRVLISGYQQDQAIANLRGHLDDLGILFKGE